MTAPDAADADAVPTVATTRRETFAAVGRGIVRSRLLAIQDTVVRAIREAERGSDQWAAAASSAHAELRDLLIMLDTK